MSSDFSLLKREEFGAYSRIKVSIQNSGEPEYTGGCASLLKLAISGRNRKPIRGIKWCRDWIDRVNFWGLKSRSDLIENIVMDTTGDYTQVRTSNELWKSQITE
jgi:hypothetical protein